MFKEDLEKIQKLLSLIPQGKVTTYSLMAKALGKPKSWRYVGYLLKSNPEPEKYPCYKVVKSSGEIGGYSGENGQARKIRRLAVDNVTIKERKVVDFESKIFNFCAEKIDC